MNECSTKEEQENKFFLSDALNLQLINLSINGKYEQLKIFLEKYSPNKAEIDLAIRKCLYKFKSSNINYCNTLKELFRYADLNYCNPIFDNSNLLMHICAKSNTYIFDLIFEQNFKKIKINKIIKIILKEKIHMWILIYISLIKIIIIYFIIYSMI